MDLGSKMEQKSMRCGGVVVWCRRCGDAVVVRCRWCDAVVRCGGAMLRFSTGRLAETPVIIIFTKQKTFAKNMKILSKKRSKEVAKK